MSLSWIDSTPICSQFSANCSPAFHSKSPAACCIRGVYRDCLEGQESIVNNFSCKTHISIVSSHRRHRQHAHTHAEGERELLSLLCVGRLAIRANSFRKFNRHIRRQRAVAIPHMRKGGGPVETGGRDLHQSLRERENERERDEIDRKWCVLAGE